jgi:hypothetical protein
MNILCVYWRQNPEYRENDPASALPDHNTTTVHSHEDMMLMLRDGQFDIVLCDINYPRDDSSCDEVAPYGGTFAMKQDIPSYQGLYKIKGLGIFIPGRSTEGFHATSPENELVVVAANRCVTIDGYRDWRKLLNAVVFRLERGDIPF